mmetsp:Transcript_40564/g.67364  ORF Transcript_40564/g.67364 Transcript_40564/m.67364 type:complete len:264 (-) Transcript_40564:41-832(-)
MQRGQRLAEESWQRVEEYCHFEVDSPTDVGVAFDNVAEGFRREVRKEEDLKREIEHEQQKELQANEEATLKAEALHAAKTDQRELKGQIIALDEQRKKLQLRLKQLATSSKLRPADAAGPAAPINAKKKAQTEDRAREREAIAKAEAKAAAAAQAMVASCRRQSTTLSIDSAGGSLKATHPYNTEEHAHNDGESHAAQQCGTLMYGCMIQAEGPNGRPISGVVEQHGGVDYIYAKDKWYPLVCCSNVEELRTRKRRAPRSYRE